MLELNSVGLLVIFLSLIGLWGLGSLLVQTLRLSNKEEMKKSELHASNATFFLDALREAETLSQNELESYDHNLDISVERAAFNIIHDLRMSKYINPNEPLSYFTVYCAFEGDNPPVIKPLFSVKTQASNMFGLDLEHAMMQHLSCDSKVKMSNKPVPFIRVYKI